MIEIESPGVPIKAWIEGVPVEAEAKAQLQDLAKLPVVWPHIRTDQRPTHEEAWDAIKTFLRGEGVRAFELVKDGSSAWAFWPTSQPHTTSYYHADGSIEWFGQGR